MERKEIAALLIGCKESELLGFADYGEDGVAAIGPDGKKYTFGNEYLAQAVAKAEPRSVPSRDRAAKPKPPAKAGTGKRRAPVRRTTKKKPEAKKTPSKAGKK